MSSMLPTLLPTRTHNCKSMATKPTRSRRTSGRGNSVGTSSVASKECSMLTVKSLSAEAVAQNLEMQMKDLFATYDFLRESSLSKDVSLYLRNSATTLSNDNCTTKLPQIKAKGPVHEAPALGHKKSLPVLQPSAPASPLAMGRKKSLPVLQPSAPPSPLAMGQRFAAADRMDFEAFKTWLLELHPSRDASPKLSQFQFLTSLIRELKLRSLSPQVEAWKALDIAAKNAEQLHDSKPVESVHMLEQALAEAREFAIPGALGHQKLLDSWKSEQRQSLANNLIQASRVKDLQDAVEAAEKSSVKLEEDFIKPYQERLLLWQKPFMVHVTTMAGGEATVQTHRNETVAALCEKVSKDLKVKEYRLTLASTSNNCKLEPPSATLEELGVCSDEDFLAFFGQVDRWQELSIPEFLELATSLGVLQAEAAVQLQNKFDKGLSKRGDVHSPALIAQIERKEKALHEAEELRKTRAEEEKRRREKIKTELLARVTGDYTEIAKELHATWDQLHQEVNVIKSDVQADLDEALPALNAATDRLRCLRKQDVREVKYFINPPEPVRLTMQALCIVFGLRPARVKDGSGRFIEDFWPASCRLLGDGMLLQKMLDYDKDNIPEWNIRRLSPLLDHDGLSPDAVRKCSVFCDAACAWARSIPTYHYARQAVEPKIAHLRGKELELERVGIEKEIIAELMRDDGTTT